MIILNSVIFPFNIEIGDEKRLAKLSELIATFFPIFSELIEQFNFHIKLTVLSPISILRLNNNIQPKFLLQVVKKQFGIFFFLGRTLEHIFFADWRRTIGALKSIKMQSFKILKI